MSDDYRSRVRDVDFKTQYDATPRDQEVEALLSGVEPARAELAKQPGPQLKIIEPAAQFTWLKPLR